MSVQQRTSLHRACSDTHSWSAFLFGCSKLLSFASPLKYIVKSENPSVHASLHFLIVISKVPSIPSLMTVFSALNCMLFDGKCLLTESGEKNMDKSPWCKPRVHLTWHNQEISLKWAPTHFLLHVPALCSVTRPWQGCGIIFSVALKYARYANLYTILLPNQSCLFTKYVDNLFLS